ncbi:MAG TPA: efflux RND transporter periplasmic adaptor subunit [Steroidobacteraceae bacterium]|nr:efflux RND transporter periplasmic adaptor subunit [Steroidobacteraceae bacterium]
MVAVVKDPPTTAVLHSGMDRPRSRAWWQLKLWQQLLAGVVALVLVILAAVLLLGPAQRSVSIPVGSLSIAAVQRGVYHDIIPLTGEVVPHDTVYLDAVEGGRIEHILVQAGDTVTAGQPLVTLSNTALELDVLDREGRLVQSITESQSYQTQLEQNRVANQKALAQIDYDIVRLRRAQERREGLVAQHLVSAESQDQIKDELDNALRQRPMQEESNRRQEDLRQKQLPQLQAQISKLQQDLVVTHSKLADLTVRAPVSGLVTSMDLTVGESRNLGDRLGEITPATGYKLSATVDEYYLARVRPGQAASIQIDDKSWPLKVARVYPQVKSGGFVVDLAFTGATPPGLLRGQTLQGRLSLGADAPGLVLPAGAFLERSGGDWAFVLQADGHSAQRRRIKIGRRNAEQVEILSGLAAGERVITSDYTGLERIDRIDLK